mmetsp:Transcript_24947/g.52290  ORF Transcript_24947/g.52290 Transcript_24947/m.52290 type:complete len:233 (+) Transcript_24947:1377-2075(+)
MQIVMCQCSPCVLSETSYGVNRRRGGCLVEKKSSRRTSEDSDAAAIGVKIGLEIIGSCVAVVGKKSSLLKSWKLRRLEFLDAAEAERPMSSRRKNCCDDNDRLGNDFGCRRLLHSRGRRETGALVHEGRARRQWRRLFRRSCASRRLLWGSRVLDHVDVDAAAAKVDEWDFLRADDATARETIRTPSKCRRECSCHENDCSWFMLHKIIFIAIRPRNATVGVDSLRRQSQTP